MRRAMAWQAAGAGPAPTHPPWLLSPRGARRTASCRRLLTCVAVCVAAALGGCARGAWASDVARQHAQVAQVRRGSPGPVVHPPRLHAPHPVAPRSRPQMGHPHIARASKCLDGCTLHGTCNEEIGRCVGSPWPRSHGRVWSRRVEAINAPRIPAAGSHHAIKAQVRLPQAQERAGLPDAAGPAATPRALHGAALPPPQGVPGDRPRPLVPQRVQPARRLRLWLLPLQARRAERPDTCLLVEGVGGSCFTRHAGWSYMAQAALAPTAPSRWARTAAPCCWPTRRGGRGRSARGCVSAKQPPRPLRLCAIPGVHGCDLTWRVLCCACVRRRVRTAPAPHLMVGGCGAASRASTSSSACPQSCCHGGAVSAQGERQAAGPSHAHHVLAAPAGQRRPRGRPRAGRPLLHPSQSHN